MKINDKSIYLRFILKQGQGIRYGGNVAFASADPSRGPFLYTLRETSKHQVIFRTRGELAKSEYMRIIQSNSKRRMFARSLVRANIRPNIRQTYELKKIFFLEKKVE